MTIQGTVLLTPDLHNRLSRIRVVLFLALQLVLHFGSSELLQHMSYPMSLDISRKFRYLTRFGPDETTNQDRLVVHQFFIRVPCR